MSEFWSAFDIVASAATTAAPILLLTFLLIIVFMPNNGRPFLKIEQRNCPTLWSMLLYVAMVVCLEAGSFLQDDISTLPEGEAGFLEGTYAELLIIFRFVHPLSLILPRVLGRTISKWNGMLVCEVTKSFYIVMFVMICFGNNKFGFAFKAAAGSVLSVLLGVTIFRLAALMKVCRSEEGFTVDNFHAYYYGTSRSCPFSPCRLSCEQEKVQEQELVGVLAADSCE